MRCNYCEIGCKISSSGGGVCDRYHEENGTVVEKQKFRWLLQDSVEIESVPFFHVTPEQQYLQMGTVGCNARCDYCINSHLSTERQPGDILMEMTPERILSYLQANNQKGVIFALNEVTIFLPSAIAVAQLIRPQGYLTGCLTNGYQTESSAQLLAGNMDFINVSLKSIRDEFYRKHLGLPSVAPVLRNLQTYAAATHVEIVTPVSDEMTTGELEQIAEYIASVNPQIPWHLFRLFRAEKNAATRLQDLSYEEVIAFVEKIRPRLPFVYFTNFPGSRWADTVCPDCGRILVHRITVGACGSRFISMSIENNHCCPVCGSKIPMVM